MDKLVIAGGANKIYSAIGAIEILESNGLLKGITKFIGTSAGSILATLLAMGCDSYELKKHYDMIDLSPFEVKYYSVMTYYNLILNRGIYSPKDFDKRVVGPLLSDICGNSDITFDELYKKYDKVLVITGTCINRRESHYYQYESNPEMKIRDAITISCCLPILFQPIEWEGDTLVDGGLLENYPLYYFADNKLPNSKETRVIDSGKPIPEDVLGIKFVDDNTSKDPKKNYIGNDKTSPVSNYILSLFNTIYTINERRYMRPDYWNKTVSINLGSFDSISNMVLSQDQKNFLIIKGQEAAYEFVKK